MGLDPPAFVYALGRLTVRIPSLSIEKELAHAGKRGDARGLTDQATLRAVLCEPANRYLARLVCWAFTVAGEPTYFLVPRDAGDLDAFLAALDSEPDPERVEHLVGVRGSVASPQMCNGLQLAMVTVGHLDTFTLPELLGEAKPPRGVEPAQFLASAKELFWRIHTLSDNVGSSELHRAVNFLAAKYGAIYSQVAAEQAENNSLSGLDARVRKLAGGRRGVDVVFSFTDRQTDVTHKYYARVDVTEEFPFLVKKLAPYSELG
jgi:hypothetical protein